MYLKNTDDITPITSPHGEIVREYLGKAVGGAQQHSLAQITLPPGHASRKHYHPVVEESYLILSGEGRMVIGHEEQRVRPGDAIAVPVHAIHQIFNTGSTDLVFLAVCAPPWTPDCSVFID
ncbi:MAG TPA: cupin domain-containing protein [Spirillospora sp.]|nr:cupin domain-containing protein [Spirillospora sp.]